MTGARVRLNPGTATGFVERVRGEVAEVAWDAGARSPVPVAWLRVVSDEDHDASAAVDAGRGTLGPPALSVTRSCARCGGDLEGRSDSIYCSGGACKQAAYRARRGAGA